MSNSRNPLSNGTVLYCGDDTSFTIYENHQYGGNSLIYSARQSGSERLFKIKECFPVHESYTFIRNQEGRIVPLTPNSRAAWEYIEECKENLQEEGVLGQKIAAHSGKIIAPMQEVRITSVGDSAESSDSLWKQFLVMEDFRQKGVSLYEILAECEKERAVNYPLRSNGQPDVRTVLLIIKDILQVLDHVHKEGYVYGDIQMNNLFFVDPHFELGEIGVCHLLDFGCSLRLACGDRTEELVSGVQTTDLFSAPEIRYENDGHLQLTQAADIFSIGCLMHYLLKWGKYVKDIRRIENCEDEKKLNAKWNEYSLGKYIDARSLEGRGGSREITDQINRILRRALQREPGERYRNAGEMLPVIQALYEKCLEEQYAPAGREKLAKDINANTDHAFEHLDDHFSRVEHLIHDRLSFPGTKENQQISPEQVYYASKRWYEWSRQAGKRFSYLQIGERLLLAETESEEPYQEDYMIPTIVIKEGDNRNKKEYVSDILKDSAANIFLIGEGGIGKTTALYNVIREYYENDNNNIYDQGLVPVFIELARAPERFYEKMYNSGNTKYGPSSFICREVMKRIRSTGSGLDEDDGKIYEEDERTAVAPIYSLFFKREQGATDPASA